MSIWWLPSWTFSYLVKDLFQVGKLAEIGGNSRRGDKWHVADQVSTKTHKVCGWYDTMSDKAASFGHMTKSSNCLDSRGDWWTELFVVSRSLAHEPITGYEREEDCGGKNIDYLIIGDELNRQTNDYGVIDRGLNWWTEKDGGAVACEGDHEAGEGVDSSRVWGEPSWRGHVHSWWWPQGRPLRPLPRRVERDGRRGMLPALIGGLT